EYEPPPGRLLYYVIKGGGWVQPFDENGNYIESVDAAYEHLHNQFGRVRRFLRETAIGTLILGAARVGQTWLYQLRAPGAAAAVPAPSEPDYARLLKQYAHSYHELRKTQQIAEKLGGHYYTLVIPALGKGCLPSSDFTVEVQRPALREFHPIYMDLSDHH